MVDQHECNYKIFTKYWKQFFFVCWKRNELNLLIYLYNFFLKNFFHLNKFFRTLSTFFLLKINQYTANEKLYVQQLLFNNYSRKFIRQNNKKKTKLIVPFYLILDGELEAKWLISAGFPELVREFEQVKDRFLSRSAICVFLLIILHYSWAIITRYIGMIGGF